MPEPSLVSEKRGTLALFHRDLILTASAVAITFVIVMSAAVFVPLAARLHQFAPDERIAAGIADYILFMHSAFWPVVLVSWISCVASASILYRRMRSPLARFVQAYRAIAEGEDRPSAVRIRATDYLSDEAEELNCMLAALAKRADARESIVRRLGELEWELAEQGVDPALRTELAEIAKHPALTVGLREERSDG